MKVVFENNGITRNVKVGFSWTTFFFGGFALLFRKEIWEGLLLILATIILSMILIGPFVPIIWSFFANKYTARKLISQGWKPTTVVEGSQEALPSVLIKWGVNPANHAVPA